MSTMDILGNTSEQADSIRLMLKVRGMKDGRFIDADPLIILKADNHQGSDRWDVYVSKTVYPTAESYGTLAGVLRMLADDVEIMATLVIHQRVVFRPDTTIENPEDVNGPSFIDPDSGFDCSRCGQSMSRDWFTIQGNRIKPDFRYCPGCAGVATPYRDDTINPSGKEATQ